MSWRNNRYIAAFDNCSTNRGFAMTRAEYQAVYKVTLVQYLTGHDREIRAANRITARQ